MRLSFRDSLHGDWQALSMMDAVHQNLKSFSWSNSFGCFDLQEVPYLLELLPSPKEEFNAHSWASYALSLDTSFCMTKLFVEASFGLLYRFYFDDVHYHDKIEVIKAFFDTFPHWRKSFSMNILHVDKSERSNVCGLHLSFAGW